ncbi:hypothetical protein FOZ60_006834 [Perkinsus olseni]|uniref:Uncharacterized protein n=1 Tax=Perkinsus olseni TaxID=32597 RepID=A0A7J6NMV5_PEROL|nr:hypothetical protein FOZ60_006834 [Perkinsus olseni]
MLPLNLSVEAHLTALVTVDDSAQLLALAGRPVEPLHDGIQTFEDGEILFPVDDFIIHAEALPAAAGGGRCGMEKNTETTLRRITVSNDAVVVWRDRRVLAAPIVVSSSPEIIRPEMLRSVATEDDHSLLEIDRPICAGRTHQWSDLHNDFAESYDSIAIPKKGDVVVVGNCRNPTLHVQELASVPPARRRLEADPPKSPE